MNKEKESKEVASSDEPHAVNGSKKAGEEEHSPKNKEETSEATDAAEQEETVPTEPKSEVIMEKTESKAKEEVKEPADEKEETVSAESASEEIKEKPAAAETNAQEEIEEVKEPTNEKKDEIVSADATSEELTEKTTAATQEEVKEMVKKAEEPVATAPKIKDSGKEPQADNEQRGIEKAEKETSVNIPEANEETDITSLETKEDKTTDKKPAVTEAKNDAPGKTPSTTGTTTEKDSLHSEDDLKEKDEEDHHDDDDEVDYSEMSKEELVAVIKELARDEQVVKAERTAREVKTAFNEIRDKEREEALKKFINEGGNAIDFSFRPDELTLRFDANYQLVRDRKFNFVKSKEQQKETNLSKKEDILERLRHFVDSEETNISFDSFKKLQEEWKNIGPVPGNMARTLWANYNALVDRFYDNRSIYYELKELDRRKNLEGKLELCERAEKLSEVENINEAIKELNDLHHEFKHIGPVPQDEQEPLWQRFKGASDAVYERRKVFVDKLKGELDENLNVKLELAEKVKEFADFDSDRIKSWNEKTKELLDIQKKWENTGGLPRARAKDVNRTFWSSFKQFFSNKNQFFKKLDAEREQNLEKKKEMVERAKELSISDEWHSTAEALKGLQREWKDVGPVPGKFRESIYKEFKTACDSFFEKKRASSDDASRDYSENYKKKITICDQIEKLADSDKNNLDKFKELQEEYNETGFVPRNKISETRNRYNEVVNKFVKELEGLSREEKQIIKIENQVSDILHSPNADQKLYRKEQTLRKQISTIENDIALWKNNMEFFAESKKANKLKDEFQAKIDSAIEELKQLKQQLRIIRTA